jgi:RNA polymerase sigma-70 factor (ECF subfamily)
MFPARETVRCSRQRAPNRWAVDLARAVGAREDAPMNADDPPDGPGGDRDQARGHELRRFLDRIRAGDELAARELLARYEPQVRLVVRRQLPRLLRSRFDSLDFLQSVWGSFFRRMRSGPVTFEDPRYLVTFLARVARNKVVDQYRRASSEKHDMKREEPLVAGGSPPREFVADQDSASEVAEANEAFGRLRDLLPAGRREILGLKVEGLSCREIGRRLGLSERTVRRALEELRHRSEAEDQPEG